MLPQMEGVHALVLLAPQAPLPLHTAALVAWPPAQLGCTQVVSLPGSVQVTLVPVQIPPQVPVPAQAVCPARGAPVMKPQVPALQSSHEPLHAELQQTPSAQKLFVHSSASAQVMPLAFLAVQTPP